jgi:hypothetical protein
MGLRSKIKTKVKQILDQAQVVWAVVQDEANHPGRPQPHMAARNPFWGGGETESDEDASAEKETEKAEHSSEEKESTQQGSLDEEEADFWFLKYEDNEGWNETNPGKEK